MSKPWMIAVAMAIVGVVAARAADACIWYYGKDLHGATVRVGGSTPATFLLQVTDHREHEQRRTASVEPPPAPDADWKARSDHAANLLYQGRAREAVAIFEAIEREHTGQYEIAANLGTAYELAGDDAKALEWIREGVRRNPEGHDGTEWLHVKILEAKLALAADPTWLASHTVLALDFGDAAVPRMPAAWPPGKDAATTRDALRYQLHERMGFVTPPDPLIADLLVDLANLVALTMSLQHADRVYGLALEYRPIDAGRVERRRAALRRTWFRDDGGWWLWLVPWPLAVGGAAVAAVLAIRRRRRTTRPAT